jgi:hypothetical protein
MDNRLKKIGDYIAEQHKYEFADGRDINREKISELILKHIKTLPKEQRSILALYIENKVDCRVERIEEKIDEILDLIKINREDIKLIKGEIYTNGKEN